MDRLARGIPLPYLQEGRGSQGGGGSRKRGKGGGVKGGGDPGERGSRGEEGQGRGQGRVYRNRLIIGGGGGRGDPTYFIE